MDTYLIFSASEINSGEAVNPIDGSLLTYENQVFVLEGDSADYNGGIWIVAISEDGLHGAEWYGTMEALVEAAESGRFNYAPRGARL